MGLPAASRAVGENGVTCWSFQGCRSLFPPTLPSPRKAGGRVRSAPSRRLCGGRARWGAIVSNQAVCSISTEVLVFQVVEVRLVDLADDDAAGFHSNAANPLVG